MSSTGRDGNHVGVGQLGRGRRQPGASSPRPNADCCWSRPGQRYFAEIEVIVETPDFDVIRDAVTLASRAPSLHNSQPWRWVAEGPALQLWADPPLLMHATDRTGRELILSCGAVLDHLRVAMAAAGWHSNTERFPDPDDPDHLATLRFQPMESLAEAYRLRADAIGRRHTDRLPFGAPAAWPALWSLLCRAVAPFDVLLDVVADADRPRLAEASQLTETLRRYDTSYMSELRWWTSPFETGTSHVPESSLVSSSEAARVDVARAFPRPVGDTAARPSVTTAPRSWWSPPDMTTLRSTCCAVVRRCRRYCRSAPWPVWRPAR